MVGNKTYCIRKVRVGSGWGGYAEHPSGFRCVTNDCRISGAIKMAVIDGMMGTCWMQKVRDGD
jgi:hypothetical protein